MQINLAHLRDQGIDFAVFDADATSRMDGDRSDLLASLTARARISGLKVDKSALAFREGSRTRFYGPIDLVHYLALRGVSRWTHSLEV